MLDGRVVPVLGAGVNLCDRPKRFPKWKPESTYLPSGAELAEYLAKQSAYRPEFYRPRRLGGRVIRYDPVYDLVRVSQYVEVAKGSRPLHRALHHIFDRPYRSSVVHHFLARLAKVAPAERPLLMLTTNYDDALEQALRHERVAYDVLTYVSDYPASTPGHFTHSFWTPESNLESTPTPLREPTKKNTDPLTRRPAIVKIHGAARRGGTVDQDNYVITEDDYIEFLVREDRTTKLLPVGISQRLPESHFLFLGYALRDWNLRVLLRRIREGHSRTTQSWSVRLDADAMEQHWWEKQDVTTLPHSLPDYILALRRACVEEFFDSFGDDLASSDTTTLENRTALFKPLSDEDDWGKVWEGLQDGDLRLLFKVLPEERSEWLITLRRALIEEIRKRDRRRRGPSNG